MPGMKDITKLMDAVKDGALDHRRMLDLFSGVDNAGRPYYAYVAVIPSKYMDYRSRLAAGEAIVLKDYGDIIAEGDAVLPPADLQKRMSDALENFRVIDFGQYMAGPMAGMFLADFGARLANGGRIDVRCLDFGRRGRRRDRHRAESRQRAARRLEGGLRRDPVLTRRGRSR